MAKYIERERIEKFFDGIYDCADLVFEPNDHCCAADDCGHCKWYEAKNAIAKRILSIPAADVVERKPLPEDVEELIQRLRETSMDFGEADHVSVMLLEAAEAIETLSAYVRQIEELRKDGYYLQKPKR